jgi:hypothetical protein
VTTIGGLGTVVGLPDFQGNADGVGSAARFAWPTALTVGGDGAVFVADYWNNAIRQGTPIRPILSLPQFAGGTVQLNWTTIANQRYQLQASADLSSANWSNVGGVVAATNNLVSVEEVLNDSGQRFYRVLLVP